MKPWLETISFSQPLRDVRTAPASGKPDCAAQQREREKALYERGRIEGESALNEQLIRQRAELMELQNGILESLRQSIPRVARQCENGLVELALEVARKLVSSIPITAEMIEGSVREAIGQVAEATDFQIHLHPEDLELLQNVSSPLLEPGNGVDKIQFKPSPDVTRGGCLVQTRFGIIDARRETKFDLIQKSIQQA